MEKEEKEVRGFGVKWARVGVVGDEVRDGVVVRFFVSCLEFVFDF